MRVCAPCYRQLMSSAASGDSGAGLTAAAAASIGAPAAAVSAAAVAPVVYNYATLVDEVLSKEGIYMVDFDQDRITFFDSNTYKW